jgi:hypothetical protein
MFFARELGRSTVLLEFLRFTVEQRIAKSDIGLIGVARFGQLV